jgi:hypothetical protein
MTPRRREIEAAIAAHNDADREPFLPPEAGRLLAVMFPAGDVCQRRLNDLAAEGFSKRPLRRLLQALVMAGLLSKAGPGRPVISSYHLHLPAAEAAMTRRREEIEAAIAAHNADDREPWLPPEAVRLLTVMFRRSSVCQRKVDSLMEEGFSHRRLRRLLDLLAEAGFLSWERGAGVPSTYRLHLPPQAQP